MISRSKQKKETSEKIGTIGDLVNPDLLQILESSTRSEKEEPKKKIKVRIKKR